MGISTLLINSVAIFLAAYLLDGVKVENFFHAVLAAFVLGLVNIFIKPIVVFLTLPFTIITLGLFTLIINALMLMIVDKVLSGIEIRSFGTAVIFGILISIFQGIIFWIV